MKKYKTYIISVLLIIATLISICFVPIRVSKLIPIIESQVTKELNVKVHIDKLILRVGPQLKLKTPIMHVMYEDGQKFAQLDNVKFYISWHNLFNKNTTINRIIAKKIILKINSNDKYLSDLIQRLSERDINELPNLSLKEYSLLYNNRTLNDKYLFEGTQLDVNKIMGYKSVAIKTIGDLSINNKKYINYDIYLQPRLNLAKEKSLNFNIEDLMTQIQELDFHSDIIADLKLYYSQENVLQGSGFVNIDNISVLDIAKKNPKSFIYLTLWGDKASISSNIHTSQTDKVSIEGMINNSKKPVIDLKVKTDKVSLNDLYKKIKILTNFSELRNISSLDGTLNANFTLKGDINKIKSNGFLKIANANIKANGIEVNNINSEIDFSNNAINIVNAIGYVNKSPIMLKGHINKELDIEAIMSKVELKDLFPIKLGVKSGIASIVAKINGTLDKVTHTENLQIDDFLLENNDIKLSLDALRLDTNKSNTASVTNLIFTNQFTEQMKIPTLKIQIEQESLKIPKTNIYMPNSLITLKSDITNYNNPNIAFNAILDGFINAKDLKNLSADSDRYPVKFVFNGNKNIQNLNGQLLIENTAILDEPALVNLSAKVEKETLKIEDLSVVSFSGKFSDDLKANLKGGRKLAITGNVENFKEPLLKNVRIFIPQILNLHYKDIIAQLKGDVFLSGKLNKLDIVGQLLIQNLFSQATQVSVSNCSIDFNKNNIALNAPMIKLADSTMAVVSDISTDISEAITIKNMSIKSKFLNTNTFLMYKDLPIIKAYPVIINSGKLYSEKILANIYDSQLYLSSFSTDLSMKDEIINFKNISSEIYNGKIGGSLAYNLKDEHFDSKIMGRGVSVAPIFDIVSARKDRISGVMDFDTDLKGELTSKQSLNGNIKFIANNGRMSTLGKLEHLLYAQNVIADNLLRTSLSVVTKAITLKDTGLFKYLRGDIDLRDGIANIKLLQSQGPHMALFIKGVYNPLNDYAQLFVLGRLSDEIISGLGAFGDFSFNKLMIMLTGEELNNNTLPEDYDKLPQLPAKNTKEFRSIINGIIDKPSSVLQFNWISYSEKSLKQKDVPLVDMKIPSFVDKLPY